MSDPTTYISQKVSFVSKMDSDDEEESELISHLTQIIALLRSMDPDTLTGPESKLISITTRIISLALSMESDLDIQELESELIPLITKICLIVNIMELESEPEADSELSSLISQIISLVSSMDSDPQSGSELISLVTHVITLVKSVDSDSQVEQKSELISRVSQVVSLVSSIELKRRNDMPWDKDQNAFVERKYQDYANAKKARYKEYSMAPPEVKHLLHSIHSLRLGSWGRGGGQARSCYCCGEDIIEVFYYCEDCLFFMNVVCVLKPPLLAIDHPKWHEHTLAVFPRPASLTCNLCALADDSSCPIYMCPPCDFVVHRRCLNLPRVIKISRHRHRISFIPFIDQGDCSCRICREKIDNDYGGYSCVKNGCSFAAHSKCATQSKVWDGKELEGEPEEVAEPFIRISEGIIQHFSHQHHHLRLDENIGRDYNNNKECQACVMPIYFGNLYSCMECDFILHETCANFPRKMHHPIHPHPLTFVTVNSNRFNTKDSCSVCPWLCTGFFYECKGCNFKLHVQCATISEPLVHESHKDPLFLTSKPGEFRFCSVCHSASASYANETFNCIECDFALCIGCATLPQKVRYKHDNHILTISYGKETNTTTYWCEACEKQIDLKKAYYMCDEYCCVTLHVECLIGRVLYMKPGSSVISYGRKFNVLRNNHMSRPICANCKGHCQYRVFFRRLGTTTCLATSDC